MEPGICLPTWRPIPLVESLAFEVLTTGQSTADERTLISWLKVHNI